MSITLLCLVKGNTAANAFAVDIEREKLVSHLKKAIKAEKQNDFASVDADKLKLWKVEISDERNDLLSDIPDQAELLASRDISDYWAEEPPKRHIHVIVNLPLPNTYLFLCFLSYVIIEQPVAATHQSTSIENLAHDLGQLNLSGGAANMSLSDLLLSILKTTKENSDQIKENLDQIKENWDQIKENSDQINSLIQIEQARNREPVLGKYELEDVRVGHYLSQCNSDLYDLPKLIKNFLQNNPVSQASQTLSAIQKWFNKLMNLFSQQWHNLIVKDTHNIGYLCELMPDLSFFRKEDAVDDAYIPMLVQTILELKAQKTSTGFSNEEKGQLLDYIHILVRQQPLRKLFAIFLSNGSYFYVMPYDRDTNEYQQYETTFSNGLRLLHTLVSRNSDFIKAIGTRGVNFRSKISSTCVSPTKIYLEELLVEGSSAIVYRIKWRNSPAVIKSFKKVSDYNVLNEVEILQFLNDSNVQNIPEYVAHDDKNIIFYPVCSKIDKRFFRAKHARELLQVLERIHSLKIYHRDVRPSNIMIDTTNNSLILVDWGSAVRDPNGEVAYEGTSTYASPGILNNNMGLYKPRPADDLHSFVRTIYVLLNLNPLRKPRNLKSIAEIRNYWNRELNDRPFWTDMLTAADNENIEELKKLCDIV